MRVVNASLLDAPQDFAIVQCISEDCAMGITPSGKEIPCLALTIRKIYPMMSSICKTRNPSIGDVIPYIGNDGRKIFNLVTKEKYYNKPTYEAMFIALSMLRRVIIESGVLKLAIPKLGSGLDKLEWGHVSYLVKLVFHGSGIEIVLYDPK